MRHVIQIWWMARNALQFFYFTYKCKCSCLSSSFQSRSKLSWRFWTNLRSLKRKMDQARTQPLSDLVERSNQNTNNKSLTIIYKWNAVDWKQQRMIKSWIYFENHFIKLVSDMKTKQRKKNATHQPTKQPFQTNKNSTICARPYTFTVLAYQLPWTIEIRDEWRRDSSLANEPLHRIQGILFIVLLRMQNIQIDAPLKLLNFFHSKCRRIELKKQMNRTAGMIRVIVSVCVFYIPSALLLFFFSCCF